MRKSPATTKQGKLGTKEYMAALYREHFLQSYQGLRYTAQLPEVKQESLKKKSLLLG